MVSECPVEMNAHRNAVERLAVEKGAVIEAAQTRDGADGEILKFKIETVDVAFEAFLDFACRIGGQ